MKLNVIRGYKGALTDNQYMPVGVYDLDDPLASLLIRKGFAVLVESQPETIAVKLTRRKDAPPIEDAMKQALIDLENREIQPDPEPIEVESVHLVSITKPARKLMKEWDLTQEEHFPNDTLITKPMVDAYVHAHFITDENEQG